MSGAPTKPWDTPYGRAIVAVLERIGRNESIATYREFEDLLAPVARALLTGWRPEVAGFQGLARQRVGYLVDLVAGWMPERQARYWQAELARLGGDKTAWIAAPFFHGDPVSGPCGDDVARSWGLTRGLNIARLRQALESPGGC